MTAILGISAFYHDSAAALVRDGRIVAAAQEERFTRVKHDPRYPRHSIDMILAAAGMQLRDVDYVVFYDKPFLKFERLMETYLAFAPRGFRSFSLSMPIWLTEKLYQKKLLITELDQHEGGFPEPARLLFAEHHYSHAASAFYPSPFEEAVVLTVDGVGEWATTAVAVGRGNELEIEREIHFPHSLGLLYSAFTYYAGFKVNSGEYKLMGLAPYGTPRFRDLILEHLLDLKQDGTFRLDQNYFDYCTGSTMTNERFADLFGEPPRSATEPLTQFHMDIAASIQSVTEEVLLQLTRSLAEEYAIPNLCMAGGVALNCVANSKILQSSGFRRLWIQPAAGDAGGALGSALAAWHRELGKPREVTGADSMSGALLGPAYSQQEIESELSHHGAVFDVLDEPCLLSAVCADLVSQKACGWFQGRMEFGPRALGNRSILGDPRSPVMQRTLNLKVKYRESFRPFAPSVRIEDASDWFDLNVDSPYMLLVAEVAAAHRRPLPLADAGLKGLEKLRVPRSDVPAITHVDLSARLQTVSADVNPRYHRLLTAFKERTGCPILVNTSFNVRGEPIVCTPAEAFRCFMGTEIETLAIGNCYLDKSKQRISRVDYKSQFSPD